MLLAIFYSQGKIPVLITAAMWSRIYFGHFLFMVLGGASLLFFSYRNTGLFFAQNLVEFMLGVGAFVILFSAAGAILAKGRGSPWISLGPGGFLLYYGFRLATRGPG